MIHYCPQCGNRSWHEPGVWAWAVPCPDCGCVAAQQPHPPDPSAVAKPAKKSGRRPRKSGAGRRHVAEAVGVLTVESGGG